jgi:hypothetical protein
MVAPQPGETPGDPRSKKPGAWLHRGRIAEAARSAAPVAKPPRSRGVWIPMAKLAKATKKKSGERRVKLAKAGISVAHTDLIKSAILKDRA